MIRLFFHLISGIILICVASLPMRAEKVVILHTNDTHSQIEPEELSDLGGVARRKVLIDSIRAVEPNVILVDAGDVVQGSLYFTVFEGKVESAVMNALGYDIMILGNHEFDKGINWIADFWKDTDAAKLATNYNLKGTPLDSMASPYKVITSGGHRIGFFAINLDPRGIILDNNFGDIKYLDPVKAANSVAWYLKNIENVDKVVAITHIGYVNKDDLFNDRDLIKATENIDLLIGGHSHTAIGDKPDGIVWKHHPNSVGDSVVVAQTGRTGYNLGKVVIDFDNDTIMSSLIPVDKRLDSRLDTALLEVIAPYKHVVDSIKAIKIGHVMADMVLEENALLNFMADYVKDRGSVLSGKKNKVDLAIVNRGGVRRPISEGYLTKGQILESFPFDNKVVVLELPGSELLKLFDSMAHNGGEGVSSNVEALMDAEKKTCKWVTISGKPIDANKIYRIATIDYLAQGKDGLVELLKGEVTHVSPMLVKDDMIADFESGRVKGRKINYDNKLRMHY